MQKTNKAKEELQDQSSYIDLPEMKNKRKECQEAEKQLMEIEQKLGEDKHCRLLISDKISSNSTKSP